MYAQLIRQSDDGIQTLGNLRIWDENDKIVLFLNTIELSWKNNQRQVSCIPVGIYKFNVRFSVRFGWCFEIKNVVGRSGILIHAGNFSSQTKGCVLVGSGYGNINHDDIKDLFNSRKSLKALLTFCPQGGVLKIENSISIQNG